MRHSILLLPIIASLVISTRLNAQRAEAGHWSCYTEYAPTTIYTTQVWDATAFMEQVQNGFSQFLLTKFGYTGQVLCGRANVGGVTVAKLQDDDRRRNAQWRGQGKTVVESGFTFDPATTSLAFACAGFTRRRTATGFVDSVFISPVIRTHGSAQDSLTIAWNDHLKAVHALDPMYPAGCYLLPPDPARHQAVIDDMPAAWNSPHPAIVLLDWSYPAAP